MGTSEKQKQVKWVAHKIKNKVKVLDSMKPSLILTRVQTNFIGIAGHF